MTEDRAGRGVRALPLAAIGVARTAAAPLIGSYRPPEPDPHRGDACITCGDVALPLTVVEVIGTDARCRADDGGTELVACDFVGPVAPGDRVLVHAKVALELLDRDDAPGSGASVARDREEPS